VFDKITIVIYNDQGDKAEERTTFTENGVIPTGVPHSIDENGALVPSQPAVEPQASPMPEHPKFIMRINTTATATGRNEPQMTSPAALHRPASAAANSRTTDTIYIWAGGAPLTLRHSWMPHPLVWFIKACGLCPCASALTLSSPYLNIGGRSRAA